MSFFKTYQKQLEKNYPGITERILTRELGHLDIEALKKDLLAGVPLNYLLKNKYFFNREFYVDERVLIPRNETEILVEEALKYIKPNMKVLDLCAGSGNIGLSIYKELNGELDLTLSELDEKALEVLKINAQDLDVKIIQSNLFENLNERFDIILSNPPYISTIHQQGVHENVDRYEPAQALYIDEDKYKAWFDKLFKGVFNHLNNNGLFIMEGHEDKLLSQQSILQSIGFHNLSLIKDLTSRTRFIKGSKNE